jgi:hypothetical protein
MSVFSSLILPTQIVDIIAVMILIGTIANRMLSNTIKNNFRNCTITLSLNRVIRGPRLDASLFAKVLALIADIEAADSAITTIVIHIIATIPISLRLRVVVEGRGTRKS